MTTQQKLRQLMAEREMNCERLAVGLQAAGHDVSIYTVLNWYHGRREPRGLALRALAQVLGVPMEQIVADLDAVV